MFLNLFSLPRGCRLPASHTLPVLSSPVQITCWCFIPILEECLVAASHQLALLTWLCIEELLLWASLLSSPSEDDSVNCIFRVPCKVCFAFSSCPNSLSLSHTLHHFYSNPTCTWLRVSPFPVSFISFLLCLSVYVWICNVCLAAAPVIPQAQLGGGGESDNKWQTVASCPSAVWSNLTGCVDPRQSVSELPSKRKWEGREVSKVEGPRPAWLILPQSFLDECLWRADNSIGLAEPHSTPLLVFLVDLWE